MASKPIVVIAAPPFARGRREPFTRLEEAGFDVIDARPALSLEDDSLRRALEGAWALVPGNAPRLGPGFFELAPRVRLIAKLGAGYDNIDMPEATRRGVLVCTTPGANTGAVADYTLGLILALCRRIPGVDRDVRAGGWEKVKGVELSGKTLGLVGAGAIGRAVAARAAGFGMRLMAYDPWWPEEAAAVLGLVRVELDEVFEKADILSLHCPLTGETRNVVDRRALGLMKPSALLINTARGGLIDEEALAEALSEGRLAGTALDAFAEEPLAVESPLRLSERVILSPHTAWFTEEAMTRMTDWTVDQIISVGQGGRPRHPVNPDVLS